MDKKEKLKQFARDLRKESTLSEVLLWNKLKGKQLGFRFNRQKVIDKYIVDFYSHELKLIIEIDGASHGDKIKYDDLRESCLRSQGYKKLRFLDLDVKKILMM